jgi:hypothetical protein
MPIGAPGETHLGQAAANAVLTGEKGCTSRGAALLAVIMEKPQALFREAIDVRGLVAHETAAVATEIGDADVIAEDDENVGLAALGHE